MTIFGSLRRRIMAGMIALLALVLAIAFQGARSIRQLSTTVDLEMQTLLEVTEISTGLVASTLGQIRAAEQYLVAPTPQLRSEFASAGDSAFAIQRRFRRLGGLTQAGRRHRGLQLRAPRAGEDHARRGRLPHVRALQRPSRRRAPRPALAQPRDRPRGRR